MKEQKLYLFDLAKMNDEEIKSHFSSCSNEQLALYAKMIIENRDDAKEIVNVAKKLLEEYSIRNSVGKGRN